MTTAISPAALRAHRKRKGWTQQRLADAAPHVSVPTIKRIEASKGREYQANSRIAMALAKALGVDIEDLAKPPTPQDERDEALRKFGYRPLRAMIDPETAHSYRMVEEIYGISTYSQLEMAPLFASLLAEGSLAWRRRRVEKIVDAAAELSSLGGGHFAFAGAGWRAEEGARGEQASIDQRDLFGANLPEESYDFGYDPNENNPFADYLADFATEVGAKSIEFGFGWRTAEGMPDYRIGGSIIADIAAGDSDALLALEQGFVSLKEIPEALLGDGQSEPRVAWIIARVPAEKLEAWRIARDQPLDLLSIDLDDLLNDTTREGGNDA